MTGCPFCDHPAPERVIVGKRAQICWSCVEASCDLIIAHLQAETEPSTDPDPEDTDHWMFREAIQSAKEKKRLRGGA
jgi:hypothetical protein